MAAYRIEMSCVRKDRAALQTGLRVMRMAERIIFPLSLFIDKISKRKTQSKIDAQMEDYYGKTRHVYQ